MMIYNKKIITDLGLRDPLDIWLENGWTWYSWLEMLFTIRAEIYGQDFMYFGGEQIPSMFVATNGVDYAVMDEEGRYIFSLDEKYITAIKFYENLNSLHGIDIYENRFNQYGYTDMIYNDKFFTSYFNIEYTIKMGRYKTVNGKLTDEIEIIAEASARNTEKVGIICAPRGPDLDPLVSSRDLTNHMDFVKVVPITCKNPKYAAMYIDWIMADHDNYAEMVDYALDRHYGDIKYIDYGTEWAVNATDVRPNRMGEKLMEFIDDCPIDELLIPSNIKICQELIDEYVNIFY